MNRSTLGHLATLTSVIVWGTTFVSTKVLLADFKPVELLFFRFVLGFVALSLINARPMAKMTARQEFLFALAGLSGVTLYFLMENIALTYTMASNVGVIVSIAPMFTALLANFMLENEKLKSSFVLGFVIAMAGISLISFNGSAVLKLNFMGDVLAVLAAAVWAVYSISLRKISEDGFNIIQATRKIFLYGLIFVIPFLFIFDFQLKLDRFSNPVYLANILFLGLAASALCYVTWNTGVKLLGAVRTSVYIYLIPVITVVTSVLLLSEKITPLSALGTLLTLAGLWLSERKSKKRIKV